MDCPGPFVAGTSLTREAFEFSFARGVIRDLKWVAPAILHAVDFHVDILNKKEWCAWRELNPQPAASEAVTLSN